MHELAAALLYVVGGEGQGGAGAGAGAGGEVSVPRVQLETTATAQQMTRKIMLLLQIYFGNHRKKRRPLSRPVCGVNQIWGGLALKYQNSSQTQI